MRRRAERGSVLLWVTLALGVIGALAYLSARGGAAEAELTRASADADGARYAAEAAWQHQLWRVRKAGCVNYANLAPTAFGANTYSATVTPTSGSPVTIEGIGTSPGGATASFRRSSVRIAGTQSTDTIQPGATGKDTYVNGQAKNRNYGGLNQLGVDSGGAHDYLTLLEFPLTIPPGQIILSAELELFLMSTGTTNSQQTFTVHRMTQAWTEGTGNGSGTADGATWGSSDGITAWSWPAAYDAAPVASTKVSPSFSGWHRWDVTPVVQGWANGQYANRGLVLIGNNQVRDAFFASSEHGDVAKRPRLVVTYACECGAPVNATTVTLQPGAAGFDTRILMEKPTENHGSSSDLLTDSETIKAIRSLLRFDLSSIPAGANVLAADLTLHIESNSGSQTDEVRAHRLTRAWVEGNGSAGSGATWNTFDGTTPWTTPGGDHDPAVAGSFVGSGTGPKTMSLTPLVAAWVAGTQPNHGVVLLSPTAAGNNEKKYRSSDDGDATKRPKLVVTYGCACGQPGATGSHTLQPASEGLDTYVSDAATGTNYGAGARIRISNKVNFKDQGLVRFDLTGLPPGASIDAAVLELNLEGIGSGGSGSVSAHRVTRSWEELETTWTHANLFTPWTTVGGDYEPTPAASAAISATSPGPVQWNLTPLVASWASGALPNDGVLLHGSSGLNNADFTTSDAANASQRPKLSLSWTCPCGAACSWGAGTPPPPPPGPGGTLTLTPVADTWLSETDRNNVNGSDTILEVGKDAGGKERRPLLRFDVAALPAGATVTSARLRLYTVSSFGGGNVTSIQVGAHRVTAAWAEASATWQNTAGGSFDPTPLVVTSMGFTPSWTDWSVPVGLIHEWRDGVSPNHGLLLRYVDNQKNRWVDAASREHATAEWHPQLVIDYSGP